VRIAFGYSAVIVNGGHNNEFAAFVHFNPQFRILATKLQQFGIRQAATRAELCFSADEPTVLNSNGLVRVYVAHDGRFCKKMDLNSKPRNPATP
jgi:hypothetical protein